MIRLHRVALSDKTQGELDQLGKTITGDADQAKAIAREKFDKSRQGSLFKKEIETALKAMNGGSALCFYCLHDRGVAIDHYKPIDQDPNAAFDWDNYLWSCTVCNSLEKNRKFPFDDDGTPLLLNPVKTDPYPYLPWNKEGGVLKFEEEPDESDEERRSRRVNNETIATLGLNDYPDWTKARKQAWMTVQEKLEQYTTSDSHRRNEIKQILTELPLTVAALAFMVHTWQTHRNALSILGRNVAEALDRCPEIQDWVNPQIRADEAVLLVQRSLHHKRVTEVVQDGEQFILTFEGGTTVATAIPHALTANGKKLLNAYNRKGNIIMHFYGLELVGPPEAWRFQV